MNDVTKYFTSSKILPVLTIKHIHQAVPIAIALQAAGVQVIEVTLRTLTGLDSINVIHESLPGIIVGAGTVLSVEQLHAAKDAGAHFAVSPGFLPELVEAAVELDFPYLPGVMTPTEIMFARECGVKEVKFFPAELAGGAAFLRHMHAVMPDMRFCPTGGIDFSNFRSYLALPNVFCVGGSWMVSDEAVARSDWRSISQNAKSAHEH